MILDTLEHANRYIPLHPLFQQVFKYLASFDPGSVVPGTYELEGRDLYAIISHSPGQQPTPPKLEAHDRYIDLQVTLRGSFDVGWRPRERCTRISVPYDGTKDATLFDDPPETWFPLAAGSFAVFFPEDAHAPKQSPHELLKAVFKVMR